MAEHKRKLKRKFQRAREDEDRHVHQILGKGGAYLESSRDWIFAPQGPQPPFRSHRTSATRPESRPSLAHLSLASSSTSGVPLVLCTLTRRSLQWTSMS